MTDRIAVVVGGHYTGSDTCEHQWIAEYPGMNPGGWTSHQVWPKFGWFWCPKCGAEGRRRIGLLERFTRSARTVLRRAARVLRAH